MISEMVTAHLGGLIPNEQDLALVLRTLEAGEILSSRIVGRLEYWVYNQPAANG